MLTSKLALNGGSPVIKVKFPRYNSIGKEELIAATAVIESGVLSKFIGAWNSDFYGGSKVQEFERNCEQYFNVRNAVTVNSWTSGLICAVGALEIEPGDEIIVSPWTMSATATSILHWNAIPVFADIEDITYGLDPVSIEKNITQYTKAIISVDIFGHSAKMTEICKIAKKYNLKVISDCAQSPGAIYNNSFAGTLGDIGGFSLNYHKHIHTGEGGILVTNNDEYAERMRLIRNHAEAVVGDMPNNRLINMLGYNFRMGEIEAAIGIEQLKKLNSFLKSRQSAAKYLTEKLSIIPGLKLPYVEKNCTHAYYAYPMQIDCKILGVTRDKLHSALVAEGLNISNRYQNIHLLPLFQNKIAYGSKGFPWNSEFTKREVSYQKGICPTAEYLQDNSFMSIGMCFTEMSKSEIDLIAECFYKVWANLDDLR
ncbi:DegT/DnrJ/EryC1/StrS family aminotransferase [Polynucleobacter sp. AP-Sanab-80-C2]|uniref:DegT/DnrJ/EryC1/StrS family aminotransferase n=1 Tax=Polynucleobacter sp. AP-Sanab-80-C2 TaxID=3108274 RepID=UPI002B22F7EE|nr:DegT/DnrJ/EryC1/StrS family aminotransferase [Polynucleobacter sp. AP-Sanab-80-C2]MEA9598567.1 DegT/DnrJ/EryC1/StrS family aminotransferase [Polynucleobacter sp. AP-Sanab-80-C2]